MDFTDVALLESPFIRLEPLSETHHDDLVAAVETDELWRTWYTHIPSPATMEKEIKRRIALHTEGRIVPWAIIDPRTSRAVGMTTYLNLEPANRRLEIGSTWIGSKAQGTGINTAAKMLLLQRAFEELGCIAVEFRAHWHNHQSRRAIERLGAKQDGILRNHTIFENGTVRDTVVFSIIEAEWPTVKFGLVERLNVYQR
ncbi:N-acetyltransferase [Arthrobacter sp. UCD-GKA]|uniref:GNAT family N-acetyltransferase n=1 Tax=Arthrobacter sp. UCD-GKA TaxID=1913576 RepID=UPI0008DD4DCB|nr:GNAT family protein [Arthrobacter sp. UCD-GKA]OIH84409.1 N-acetyltransferase [Arthrobacter sp. UCD-GKA]